MGTNVNVNCVYVVDVTRCNNPKVKRTLFGLGPRMCSDFCKRGSCQFIKKHPRPAPPKHM